MSEKELDNYMFLGLPRTGKTTFFCAMADNLLDVANDSDGKINLRVMSDTAQSCIENGMNKLHHQEWPDKTQYKLKEDIELSLTYNGILNDYICNFVFHDYPGEAFYEAFISKGEGNFAEDSEDLKKRLVSANGVFLLLSAENLFNDEDHYIRSNVIGAMLRFIIDNNNKAKIAILFNKVELFHEYSHDKMVKLFSKQYKIADGLIKSLGTRGSFFTVKPLGNNCEINEEGNYVPPQNLAPDGLLEPISWMIGLSLGDNNKNASIIPNIDIDKNKIADLLAKVDIDKIKNEANEQHKCLRVKVNSNVRLFTGSFGVLLCLGLWLAYGNYVASTIFVGFMVVLGVILFWKRG